MSVKIRNAILIIFSILLLLTPLAFYLFHFWKQPMSNETAIWGQFGDYLNGTFMPIIAFAGIVVTFSLGIISEKRNNTNLKIEQQKQRPLLHLGYFDAENHISLFIKNKGNGPLIITNYRLANLQTGEEKQGIYDCLPLIKGHFNNYTGSQNNTVLSAGEESELFLFEKSESEIIDTFDVNKALIRAELSKYKVVVDYKDVYDNSMPTYERSLIWFARND